jgi:L-threonylcarbamoyladenylate synthase
MIDFNEDIANCLQILKSGGTLLYPTDTIWGLGCDATNSKAIEKIFELKHRPENKSVIILVDGIQMLNRFVNEVPPVAWDIIDTSEKPITIIYDKGVRLADNAIAADGTVAVRICSNPFCNKLIHRFGKPIVSTSANISGAASPQNFSEIADEIKTRVDYVVKHRQHEKNKSTASSIIKIKANGEVTIIRK